jgi:glycosyltransferase involved in cell wall biosynthesis
MQNGLEEIPYEIIVVDNCPNKSASDVVTSEATSFPPIRYVHEPRTGISVARNRGIEAADSPFVAFIDDDEIADPNWAISLLAAQQKFNADVVLGPVLAILEEGSRADPSFVKKLYSIDWPQLSGPFFGPGHTGNALLRKDRCFSDGHRFDPDLGLTGGSDQLFFLELARANASIVWCREAIVQEVIPFSRTTYAYIWRRCFVHGQTVPRTWWLLDPPDLRAVAWFMIAGVLQFLFFAFVAALAAPFSKQKAVGAVKRALMGLGKALWMQPFRLKLYGPTDSS